MPKLFTVASLFVFFTNVSAAYAETPRCLEQIAKVNHYEAGSSDKLSCLLADPEYVSALKAVCGQDFATPSKKFSKYFSFWQQTEEIFAIFQKATDPAEKSLANTKLLRIQQEWEETGFRGDVDSTLAGMLSAESKCLR